jgi:peptidoglycan hydrolase CwlO-like protein
MGKRLSKSEKLDLILSELAKLRGEIKKLVTDRGAVAERGVKVEIKSAAGRAKKLPKQTAAEKKPASDAASPKPALVQAPQVPQPMGRTAS